MRVRRRVLARRNRGTRFLEHGAHTILNPPESTGMPFWSVNPYVGCEFGCTYCYARFAHRYVAERATNAGAVDEGERASLGAAPSWEAFERWIFVKQRTAVLGALDRDLPRFRERNRHEPQTLAIGTATDPYQPAEREYAVTRVVLDRLCRERGFHIGIVTKSALVCRDLDVLLALQQRHAVTVHISLMTVDDDVIRAFEVRSPMPHVRLRALARLVQGGVNAGVIVAPVLPGVTDGTAALRRLLIAARDAGARFAEYSPLRLYPGVRGPLFPALERHSPTLVRRYRAAYSRATDVPQSYRNALRGRFRRLASELGVQVGATLDRPPGADRQLAFWSRD